MSVFAPLTMARGNTVHMMHWLTPVLSDLVLFMLESEQSDRFVEGLPPLVSLS